jgi:hypothetical protein
MSKADLILIAKLGRNKTDPIPHGGRLDIPLRFLWDDSFHLYALGVNPGLVWCSNQAGGLHLLSGCFPLVRKFEADVLQFSKPQ